MSAGTGVIHSEFNPSDQEACCCLQIWIMPTTRGITPSYEQTAFNAKPGVTLIAAPQGMGGAVAIHADVALYAVRLQAHAEDTHMLAPGRRAYLQIARGGVSLNGMALTNGDGAAVESETNLDFKANPGGCEALLFEFL
jgi:redox-sensitive bicupin YhaK (pirin superfamily)